MLKDEIKVLLYSDDYADQLVEFIRQVWDKDLTRKEFLQRRQEENSANPYGNECGFPIALAVHKDKVVGHIALKPCGFLIKTEEIPGYWQAGIHVFPEYRGLGLATKMSGLLIKEVSIVTGFFVVKQTLKLKRRLGWALPGKIPEYVKFLKPKDFVNKIQLEKIGTVPKVIQWIYALTRLIGKPLFATIFLAIATIHNKFMTIFLSGENTKYIRVVDSFDTRTNFLWERNKKHLNYAQVRTAEYLNWAFNVSEGWIKVIYEDDDSVLGYVIISLKQFEPDTRLSEIISLSIIDIFWDFTKPNILNALLSFCEQYASANNCDIIFCTISYQNSKNTLIKNSFIPIPKSVHFSVYSSKNIKFSNKLSEWFITRGDADAAGALGKGIRG